MSPSAKRGLQLAKDLLRKWLLAAPLGERTDGFRRNDVDAAIQWIAQQEKIDAKRRKPRST